MPLDRRIKLDARIMPECIDIVAIDDLKPNSRNAKKHPERQIALLQENFGEFGFTTPLLVDEDNVIIAGHARYLAKRSGFEHLPVIRLSHLSPAKKRALAIADNKLSDLGVFDLDILSEELSFLHDAEVELGFDPRIIGFETVEIDQIVGDGAKPDRADKADDFDPADPRAAPVTRPGDLWVCGEHRLLCADATVVEGYFTLMERDKAEIVFTDPAL